MGTRTLSGAGPWHGARRRLAGLAIIGLLLGGGARAIAQDAPAPPAPTAKSPWTDPVVLERRFAEAIDAVEAACGAKFRVRPTWVLSSRATLRKVLEDELAPILRNLGEGDELEAIASGAADALVAKYEPGAHRVHVLDGGAARLARSLGGGPPDEAELRVVLAHEVTHALDFERFDLRAGQLALRTPEALKVLGALVEGHAQLVAEQVAATWGIPEAFTRFTASITAMPPIDDERLRRVAEALVAEAAFGYVQGHAFLKAVLAARGREGVEAVMRAPPASARSIERPAEWLAGGPASPAPDLDAVLARLKPLVGDAGWQTQSVSLTEAALKAQGAALAPEQRADFLKGFHDAKVLVGALPAEERQVIAMATAWATAEDALRFQRQERSTVKSGTYDEGPMKVSGAVVEGAGPDGRLTGYTVSKRVTFAGKEIPAESSLAVFGRVVVEVVVVNAPELDRAARDDALARIDAFLKDPASAAGAPATEPVRLRGASRELEVRVKGPDGTAVPRAVVEVTADDGKGFRERLRDGRARVRLGGAGKVTVRAAAGADDRRLPLGPVRDHAFAADATVVELTLPAGRTIRGRAVTADGAPVVGVEVQAAEGERAQDGDLDVAGFDRDPDGRTTTGPDGAFTLEGLGEGRHRLRLVDGEAVLVEEIVVVAAGAGDVVLRRAPPLNIELIVVDGAGKPVAGATVLLFPRSPGHEGPFQPRSERTAPDGRVEIVGVSRRTRMGLQVVPPPNRDDLASLDGEDLSAERTRLVLPPGRVIRGKVVDGDGKPARAEVRARRAPEAGDEPSPGDFRAGATTDDDGTFVLRGLPRAPVLLRADGPDARPWEDDDRPFTTVDVGTSEVRLVLERAARVTVRVLGPDGAPVRSADCAVASGARTSAETIDGGTFELPRRPTTQVVAVARAVAADGTSPAPGLVTVNPGVDVVELRLAAGAEVRGRVVDGAGKPVVGATVAVAPREVPSDEAARRATEMLERTSRIGGDDVRALVRTTSGADGGFVVKGLPAGACVVAVDPPAPLGPVEGIAADAGGDAVEIVVTTASRYTITVVDVAGRPVPGATVRVVRKQVERAGETRFFYDDRRVVDDAGQVTVGPLRPASSYGLEIAPPEGRTDLRSVSMSTWTPDDSHIELEAARTLRGRVVDGRGAPVAGARVEFDRGGSSFSSREVRTDADGRFTLEGAPVGDVRLVARLRAEGAEPETRATRVVKADEDDVVLTLERPATWRFTVDAKPGRVVTLWFGPPTDRSVRAGKVGEDGRCVLERVPVRRATVFVAATADDDRCGYLPDVEVSDAPIVVPMQPSRTITIRLKVPDGAWIDHVHVLGPQGPIDARHAEGDLFVVTGLPAGRFPVKAKVRGPSGWLSATVEAEAGTEVEVVPK